MSKYFPEKMASCGFMPLGIGVKNHIFYIFYPKCLLAKSHLKLSKIKCDFASKNFRSNGENVFRDNYTQR